MVTSVFLVLLLNKQLCSALLRTEWIVLITCSVLTYSGLHSWMCLLSQKDPLFLGCTFLNSGAQKQRKCYSDSMIEERKRDKTPLQILIILCD